MDIIEGKCIKNELNENAAGGSELMINRLVGSLDPELLKDFHIIVSRLRGPLKADKIRVYWLHDLPNDTESQHLSDGGWSKFHKLVFVSHWQRDAYVNAFNIPFSHTAVIPNGIEPINIDPTNKFTYKPEDQIKLIYHTTPHRGLNILVPVVKKLSEKHPEIHLDVYSSFGVYGWHQRDEQYMELFDEIKRSNNMEYHGHVTNEKIREKLKESHIFAYPSIWAETSCLSMIEALSAGNICIHPNYAALPETSGGLTQMYDMIEDLNGHAERLYHNLDGAISAIKENKVTGSVITGKNYIDLTHNWNIQKIKWSNLLQYLKTTTQDRSIPEDSGGGMFEYTVL